MEKKAIAWKTKGMNRDSSVSVFSPEFSYENRNLRLSTNENNTQLSWVNERGTRPVDVEIDITPWDNSSYDYEDKLYGTPIGTAVLNNKLVLFTTTETPAHIDRIYVLFNPQFSEKNSDGSYDNGTMEGVLMYKGNLNFSAEHPLETLVSYEAGHIQKVYWTDGLNQPRIINIAIVEGTITRKNRDKLRKWNVHEDNGIDTFFDFVPSIKYGETFNVTQEVSSGGTFAPGVIQYCFTYINKYAQETNIVNTSPLFYLTHTDRGGAPDGDKVTCSFNIELDGLDTSFDCVKIYAIQWMALNGVQYIRELTTIPFDKKSVFPLKYVDNGTTGSVVDNTKLIFTGGSEITALTIEEKSNTLFAGNLVEKNEKVDSIQDYYDSLKIDDVAGNEINIEYRNDGKFKTIKLDTPLGSYPYSVLTKDNQRKISTFKGGETYRFGFQLQKTTGEWSEPIFLDDKANDKYPSTALYDQYVKLVYAEAEVPIPDIVNRSIYKRIRPVIVYPNIQDRTVLCQGVLNPTVFNAKNRKDGLMPSSQASWYFRPYMAYALTGESTTESPYFSVVRKVKEEDDDYTVTYDGPINNVYILVTYGLASSTVKEIRNNGYLYFVGYSGNYRKHSIDGIMDLGNAYAFISSHPWATDTLDENNNVIDQGTFRDENGIPDYHPEWHSYKDEDGFWAGQRRDVCVNSTTAFMGNWNYELEYYIDQSSPNVERVYNISNAVTFDEHFNPVCNVDEFIIKCAGIYFYTITLPYSVSTVTRTTRGSGLQYRHYQPIHAQRDPLLETNDASENQNNVVYTLSPAGPGMPTLATFNITKAKQVEIMGSVNDYVDCEKPQTEPDLKTNTEFFVDQSIVTLNSPDIEFDNNVQKWGGENLHLRIIGAIPITSNYSSHSLLMDGSMLEASHNASTPPTTFEFGKGERNVNIIYQNIDVEAGRRMVAEALWNDVIVAFNNKEREASDHTRTADTFVNYIIHPWHRDVSYNNDFTRTNVSSAIKTKQEANALFSYNTEYLTPSEDGGFLEFNDVTTKTALTENSEVCNYRLPRVLGTSSDVDYYPNVDTVLYNTANYLAMHTNMGPGHQFLPGTSGGTVNGPIPMKYKSTAHAVIALPELGNKIGVLPYAIDNPEGPVTVGKIESKYENTFDTFWDARVSFHQEAIDTSVLFKKKGNHVSHNFLWLGELVKEPINRFGGKTKEALRNNVWTVAGETKDLSEISNGKITLQWLDGDTYYQRYDCLKTYAYTQDDANQLVEILSFMCETHVNIDGRYDNFRNSARPHLMRPDVFNTINPVYSQKNNFFVGKKMDTEDWEDGLVHPNQIWYSGTKNYGEEVDNWTNVTMASTVALDGNKGSISKLKRFNDNILAFQDTGVAQILYNENMQIATQQGVPIEIGNSGKVNGFRYLSDTIGCSNKWSVIDAPSGIYFMDSHNKDIYLFNGQFSNLSDKLGFNTWCKKNIVAGRQWNPKYFDDFVAYYDKQSQDILFTNKEETLAYSEKTSTFTSFYDYGNTPYLCNLDNVSLWARPDASGNCQLWGHQLGDYCNIFGVNVPYSLTLVGNPEPSQDKIFTNLEFRATVYGDGNKDKDPDYYETLPFDSLKVWNEYQEGEANLVAAMGAPKALHHRFDDMATLNKKFRIWRCDIPRDKVRRMDRMRNPWMYLKLEKEAASEGNVLSRTELHDVIMTYFK